MFDCEIQTGLFVLKVCGRPADGDCSACGKHICSRHSRRSHDDDAAAPKICLACYTQQRAQNKQQGRQLSLSSTARDYDYWYFDQRYNFFTSNSSYRPFNEDDYRSFERENDADFEDDTKTGNFFDS